MSTLEAVVLTSASAVAVDLIPVGGATLVISLNSGFSAVAAKSPEMGVAAMGVSMVIVPLVSVLTKNKKEDSDRVDEIFQCYKEV